MLRLDTGFILQRGADNGLQDQPDVVDRGGLCRSHDGSRFDDRRLDHGRLDHNGLISNGLFGQFLVVAATAAERDPGTGEGKNAQPGTGGDRQPISGSRTVQALYVEGSVPFAKGCWELFGRRILKAQVAI